MVEGSEAGGDSGKAECEKWERTRVKAGIGHWTCEDMSGDGGCRWEVKAVGVLRHL